MHATQTDSVAPPSTPASCAPQLTSWHARLFQALRTLLRSVRVHRRVRSLRICESLPLGEKRLLAVVQFEGHRFLIGATNNSISLLDRLDSPSAPRKKPDRFRSTSFLNGVH
jgi:flagellar biogenesis protein FliO